MAFQPDKHRRCTIRLRGYDYSRAGAYFVTICTQNRLCLFGVAEEGRMRLNDAGRMIGRWYAALEQKFPDMHCGAFVCMPDHVHFIVTIVGADPCVCPDVTPITGDGTKSGEHAGSPLHRIVQWFKTMTTNAYINGVKQNQWQPFPGTLWQRNYYERIIRDESELHTLQQYIADNPAGWDNDPNHPQRIHD